MKGNPMDKPAQKTPLTTYPHDCSILFDLRDGTAWISAGFRRSADNEARNNPAVREYGLPDLMYREEAEQLLDSELEGLLPFVLEGACMHYDCDRRCLVAELDGSAQAAEDEISEILWGWERRLEAERAFVSTEEWFEAHPPHLTSTEEDELEKVAEQAVEEALQADRILDPDDALTHLEVLTEQDLQPPADH